MKNVSKLPDQIIERLSNKTIKDIQGNEYRIEHILRPEDKDGLRLYITKDISYEDAIRLAEFLESLDSKMLKHEPQSIPQFSYYRE